jgi:trimeric autotransporter adhesin
LDVKIMQGLKAIAAALLLGLTGLIAACGGSSVTVSAGGSPPPALPQLTSISLSPPDATLAMGLTGQFSATGIYDDGTKKDISSSVTWSSASPNVVSISTTGITVGLATAVSAGTAAITASMGSVSGTTALTVTSATLVSIGVTPPYPGIAQNTRQQFTATGIYTDHSTQDLTAAVTWASANPSVASISNAAGGAGLASAAGLGSSTITATLGGVSGSARVTVTTAALVSISVTPPASSIAKGTTQSLTATGVYSDNTAQDLTAQVSWSSSDSTIASVNSAAGAHEIALGLSAGAVTISASFGGVSGTTALTVTAATLVSIDATPTNASLAKGTQRQFTATGIYSDNSAQDITALVTWSSSAPSSASISNAANFEGLTTALGQGSTTITAALGGVSGSTALTVTAATLVSIGVTPALPSIAKGTVQQFIAIGIYTDNSTQDLTASATWTSTNPTIASISNASGSNGVASAAAVGTTSVVAAAGSVASPAVSLTVTPPTLVSIAVTAPRLSIAKGTTVQFTATGTYTDNSTQDLTTSATWLSASPTIAPVNNAGSNGLATAVAVGTTSVIAASGTITSPAVTLTVTPATLVSIAVTAPSLSIAKGTTVQFTATGTYTDNSTQDLTTSATWLSATPSIAPVDNAGSNGLATAVAVGTTSITAASGTITSPAVTLTVTPATLVSIAVTPANPSIIKGSSQQFVATGTYTDGTTQILTSSVTWMSSATATAAISNAPGSNGLATGLAAGAASITAASGSIVSPAVTLTVTPTEYAYAANYGDGTVSQYTIGTSGALIPMSPATVVAGAGAFSVTVDPTHHFAYAANFNADSVSQYTIGADGSLTPMSAPTVLTGANPNGITVDPSGRYAYVADYGSNSVSQYVIAADGSLTPMTMATVAADMGAASVTLNAAGTYAYVANYLTNTVSQYTVGTDGSLTPMAIPSVSTGSTPDFIVIDPTGRYAYVANYYDNGISQYAIGTDGSLSPMSPATVMTGATPLSLAIDPTGSYLYAANSGADSVAQLSIGAGGALTLMNTATLPTGSAPSFVAIDPSGRYAYVADRGTIAIPLTVVSQFTIAADGSLTPLGTPPAAPAGSQPTSIATATAY